MVPGIRIEVTAIRIAGAITTDGDIGIPTLEAAWQYAVEQPCFNAVHLETGRLHSLHPTHRVKKGTGQKEGPVNHARERAGEQILLTVSISSQSPERKDDVKANQFGARDCNTMSNEIASALNAN
jgi:hypothetical protein